MARSGIPTLPVCQELLALGLPRQGALTFRQSPRGSTCSGSAVSAYCGCLKQGSFTGDIDVDIDVEVDVDLDSYFGCLEGVSKSFQVLISLYGSSYGTHLDNSGIASPVV